MLMRASGFDAGPVQGSSAWLAYLPLVSTFRLSSSFICLIIGSRLASPVVCVVVAGRLSLGTGVCSGGVVAGRVAVVLGGSL
jgi:hypothetical protein